MSNLFKSDFSRNSFILVLGSVLGQAISSLTLPLQARLYSPQEIGTFAIYFSIVSGLAAVASARYELAIILLKEDKASANTAGLAFCLLCFFSLFCLLWVLVNEFFFHSELVKRFMDPLENGVLPLFVFLLGLMQLLNSWMVRVKAFKTASWGRFVQSFISNSFLLVLGAYGFHIWGLLAGNLIGLLLTVCFLFFILWRKKVVDFRNVSFREMFRQAKEYKSIPAFNLPQTLADLFLMNGVLILMGFFFDRTETGFFSFALRALVLPVGILAIPLGAVFYQKGSETYNNGGKLDRLVRNAMGRSALLALPFLLFFLMEGPYLFALVFGEKWRPAGQFARILAPWFYLEFVKTSVSGALVILGKLRLMLLISLTGAGLTLLSLFYGGEFLKSIVQSLGILSGLMCTLQIFYLWLIYSIVTR